MGPGIARGQGAKSRRQHRRFGDSTQACQKRDIVGKTGWAGGVKHAGACECRNGFVESTGCRHYCAQSGGDAGIVWRQYAGKVGVTSGLIERALHRRQRGKDMMGAGMPRNGCQCAQYGLPRLGEVALGMMDSCQVIGCIAMSGCMVERRSEVITGGMPLAACFVGEATNDEKLSEIGSDHQAAVSNKQSKGRLCQVKQYCRLVDPGLG